MKKGFIVVHNYATAFLNFFIDDISIDDFFAFRRLLEFLRDNKKALHFLEIPTFLAEEKEKALKKFLDDVHVSGHLDELFLLLIRHKRSALIRDVLAQVCFLYKKKKNILFFTITSAHQLHEDELEIIKIFLAHKTGKTVLYEYKQDKRLIAGIRCSSEALVWEYSIKKRLNDLRKKLNVQGLS